MPPISLGGKTVIFIVEGGDIIYSDQIKFVKRFFELGSMCPSPPPPLHSVYGPAELTDSTNRDIILDINNIAVDQLRRWKRRD